METIKNYIRGAIALLIIGLVIALVIDHKRYVIAEKNYSAAVSTVKSYANLNSKDSINRIVMQMTNAQLKYSNDSLLQKIAKEQKSEGIKDKNLKGAGYIAATGGKADSIPYPDTIFQAKVAIDTLVGDKWINNELILKYPGYVKITSKINLESYIFIESKRVTINPPDKFFLFRWFQKKQTILNVRVTEKNPYVINKEQRFVQIIK